MKKSYIFSFITASCLLLTSCAPVLVGLGALGGYAIGEDTLEGIYTIKKDEIFCLIQINS